MASLIHGDQAERGHIAGVEESLREKEQGQREEPAKGNHNGPVVNDLTQSKER